MNSKPANSNGDDFDSFNEEQLSIDERIAREEQNRNYKFFASMKASNTTSSSGFLGLFGALFVLTAAVIAGFMVTSLDEVEDVSVSSEECGPYEVKVYNSSGFTCKSCGSGEFGKLDLCLEENDSCNQTNSGCFAPVE